MRLRLVVDIERDGGASRWERHVDRPYPGVPRPDEWVYLGEGDDGQGLAATPIAVVSWDNDGVVTLRFDVGAVGGDPAVQMKALGFTSA